RAATRFPYTTLFRSDQAHVTVQHRQATLLQAGHVGGDLVQVLVLEAVFHLGGHHLAYLGLRAEPFADPTQHEVTVGDDANQAVVLAHREAADIARRHLPGSLLQRGGRGNDADIAAHDIADTHGKAPVVIDSVHRRHARINPP